MRRAANVDNNQGDIVKALRKLPGCTVEVGHDDILVGYTDKNDIPRTYWYEIKNPELVSKVTGRIMESKITKSEKKRLRDFTGHYRIVWRLDQILDEILR
jgi:hypothetical protein